MYYARCKRAYILFDWIKGVSIEEIERRYASANPYRGNISYGDIRWFADLTRFHLRSAYQIASLIFPGKLIDEQAVDTLLKQLEVGIPADSLDLLELPFSLSRPEANPRLLPHCARVCAKKRAAAHAAHTRHVLSHSYPFPHPFLERAGTAWHPRQDQRETPLKCQPGGVFLRRCRVSKHMGTEMVLKCEPALLERRCFRMSQTSQVRLLCFSQEGRLALLSMVTQKMREMHDSRVPFVQERSLFAFSHPQRRA